MKKVDVSLDISCMVECPKCEHDFDLFEMESLTDEGYIYSELLSRHEPFGKDDWGEIVQCPECNEKMVISRVEW